MQSYHTTKPFEIKIITVLQIVFRCIILCWDIEDTAINVALFKKALLNQDFVVSLQFQKTDIFRDQ